MYEDLMESSNKNSCEAHRDLDGGSAHLELHVSGSGSLSSGCRDLLREVGGRHDLLGQRDSVVLQEDELELVTDVGVVVDHLSHTVEQLDDLLGHVVARSSFATCRRSIVRVTMRSHQF